MFGGPAATGPAAGGFGKKPSDVGGLLNDTPKAAPKAGLFGGPQEEAKQAPAPSLIQPAKPAPAGAGLFSGKAANPSAAPDAKSAQIGPTGAKRAVLPAANG